MTLAFKLTVLVFVIILSKCSSQSVSLIGSRFVSNNSTYKAFIFTNGLSKNSVVHVEFGPKGEQNKVMQKLDLDQSPFKELSFDVPPNNFNDYDLTISTNLQNTCRQQSVNLVTSDVPIVFIQFSKPIYKTNDIFAFKIFVLSQKLVPISKIGYMSIMIENPKQVVWRHNEITELSEYGVYEKSIKIEETSNHIDKYLGIWTIYAEVDGKQVSKSFEVQQLRQENTEVFVKIPTEIAFADRRIYINIFTKNPKNRYAAIYLQAKFVNSSRIEIDKHIKSEYLTDTKTVITLDIKQDFGIKFLTSDMLLTFTVKIFDGNKPITVKQDVIIKYKDRHTIQIVRKKYFKPGFKFPIKVRVKLLDGKPDNSFNQLSTTVKYLSNNKNGMTNIEEKTYETNLKNGETIYSLQPAAKTTKILLEMKFADTEYKEEIERFPGVDEFMQISMLNKSSKIGSKVQVRVQSSEEMEQLNLLIFGAKGVIYNEQFDDAIGKDEFDFSLKLTDEMRPEARGLAFYMRKSDGAIIYDEFSLNIGFSIDNSLEISAPENAEPNQMMTIKVKTEKDSLVFLVAIDENSDLFNGDNGISRTSVYDEIAYHINRKFTNPSDYQFEKVNGFVLEPLKNGHECSAVQRGNKYDYEIQKYTKFDASNQMYFPQTLFEHSYKATSDVQSFKINIPNKIIKWKIYGISVHPTKGFTVSKTNPEISVKKSVMSGVQKMSAKKSQWSSG